MKIQEEKEKENLIVNWSPFQTMEDALENRSETIVVNSNPNFSFNSRTPDGSLPPSIAGKPWFVVATKADLPETKENYEELKAYLAQVASGAEMHPSGQKNGWCETLEVIPVSAINGHGVERITEWTVELLG
jgi:GTP-binding protein